MTHYQLNEIFLSLQGEGIRAGTTNVFVRFAGCNQTCSVESHGFDCDTEFVSGVRMSGEELVAEAARLWETEGPGFGEEAGWVVLTGGEPALQLDVSLLLALRERFKVAVETNGSKRLPLESGGGKLYDPDLRSSYTLFDWITVSPKVAEHAIRQLVADEVKYVRAHGQGIPRTRVRAEYKLLSPAWTSAGVQPGDLAHCIDLVKHNPPWRLSLQQHKLWGVR